MRENFFKKKVDYLTVSDVISMTGAKLFKEADVNLRITNVATLQKANINQISFLSSGKYLSEFKTTSAGFCLIDEENAAKCQNNDIILLVHPNPYFAYSLIADAFYEEENCDFVENCNIHPSATIGQGSKIAPLAYIGKNVKIGKNCFIGPNAAILDNCIIGDNVIINSSAVISYAIIGNNCKIFSGVKIGQDGFGFAHNAGINHKIIQIGIVEIHDNVEIGANTCIDRGAIENTVIGAGTKIDNLVQIGHNVTIGKGTVIAGCSAIAGSTKIGNYVQVGGNSGISGHIEISDGVKIAGMSGVMRDIPPRMTVGGFPAIEFRQWQRLNAKLMALAKTHGHDKKEE